MSAVAASAAENTAGGQGVETLSRARLYLLVLALLQRVAYRLECGALPFADAPLFDSVVYAHQAEAIRAGDFADASLVAFGPLYGWFLALVGDAWLEAQLALGFVTAYLVERIAAQSSPRAGLWALALWIGYPMPLFYETKMLSETLGLFLLVASVAAFVHPSARPRAMAVSGVSLGLAILTRANLLFSAPFFVVAALVPRARGEALRPRALRALALSLGLALVLSANGLWNLAWVDRFVPVILVSRTASVASSTGEWTGSLAVFGDAPSAWDVVDQAERELARPPGEQAGPAPGIDFVGWLRSSPAKLARTFADTETTFMYGFYGERTEMRSLAWQPLSMGTLLVLGLLGAVLLWRREGPASVLVHLPLVAGVVVVTTLFHPSSRYRLPMLVPLVLLGAQGLAELSRLEPRRVRAGLVAATSVAVVALGVRHLVRPLVSPAMWHVRVAEGEMARGDVDAARERVERAWALSREGDATRERLERLWALRALPPRSDPAP